MFKFIKYCKVYELNDEICQHTPTTEFILWQYSDKHPRVVEKNLFCCCKDNYVFQKYKDEISFDNKCKQLVMRRMIEQTSDYRFNPLVAIGCRIDIDKFCHHVVDLQPKDQELQGKVVKCLKVLFPQVLLFRVKREQ